MDIYGYTRINNLRTKPKDLGIKKQEKMIKDFIKEQGWELKDILSDVEGTSVSLDLPSMKKIIDLSETGEVEVIVVARLDRLTRSIKTLNQFIETVIVKNNVRLISIEEELDTNGDRGQLALDLVRIISRWDAKMISDRTKELIERKRKVGESVGHAPFGYVYRNKKLVPFPLELRTVRVIRDKRNIEKLSYHKIAKYLNESRIPSKRGGQWYAETVKTIFENPVYEDVDLSKYARAEKQK